MNKEFNYVNPFTIKKSYIFFAVLFIYQYMIMSSVFYNLRFGSANLQITIITLLFIFCAYLSGPKIIKSLGWKVILVLYLGLIFIPLKILIGQLDIISIQGMRLFYMLPLFWSLYRVYADDDKSKDKVNKIIIWNCLFIAIFGIIHFFFFPSVVLSESLPPEVQAGNIYRVPGHFQEAAFFGNSSAYGCILLTGLFGIYLSKKKDLLYSIIFIVILLGVFLSVSRWATLFGVIVFVMFIKDKLKLRMRSLLQLFLILILLIFILSKLPYFSLTLQYAFEKWGLSAILSGESIIEQRIYAGRFPGYGVALKILFGDLSHFFSGGPQMEDFIINGINFSDNSFIFLAIGYGVPLAILWILIVLFKMVPIQLIKTKAQFLLLIFFYGTIFSTPALFWDIWVLYVLGIMHVTSMGTTACGINNYG